MKTALGVWCGAGSKLLAPVHGMPLLRLVMKRLQFQATALIPWADDLDHLEAEVKSWKQSVKRCWPDERIAMRDLVIRQRADIGLLVQGDCGVIDEDEVRLALARVAEPDALRYDSPRIKCYRRSVWLSVSDTEEWAEPRSADELRRLLAPHELEERIAYVLYKREPNS